MGKQIGIELGTNDSVVSWIDAAGSPVVKRMGWSNLGLAKQNMGSKTGSYTVGEEKYSAEEILIRTLKDVKNMAEKEIGDMVSGAVLTTPAYFMSKQKRALLLAAKKAELPVLDIITEPEAVVESYRISSNTEEKKYILVYDLGAETCDISILQIGNGQRKVLASKGNPQLGGHNLNRVLFDWYVKAAEKDGVQIKGDSDAEKQLWNQVEKAKRYLSEGEEEALLSVSVGNKEIEKVLTLIRFEILIEVVVYKTIQLMNEVIQEAGIQPSDLEQILLAGGSARIPFISTLIEDELGIQPLMRVEPDQAVAVGAAYIAQEAIVQEIKESEPEPEMEPVKDAVNKPVNTKAVLDLDWEEPIVEEEPEVEEETEPEEEPITEEELAAEEELIEEEKPEQEVKPESKVETETDSKSKEETAQEASKKKKYFINYYDMFGLDRTMSEKELKKALGYCSVDINKLEASTNPNDRKMRKEIQNMKVYLLEAIKILTDPKSRKEYDMKLDEAIRRGQVEQNRTQDVEDALVRAREYFAQGKYKHSLESAREAKEKYANASESYEIIARSLFMLGDYMEAVEAADIGAKAFVSDTSLRWLAIRFRIQLELYEEAQNLLNEAKRQFGETAQFMAEQAYLYLYAEKEENAKKSMEEYIRKNPNDMEFRQTMAYNLIEIANMCYKYDSNADMLLITEEEDYEKGLSLITLANQYYQDEYTKSELEKVSKFGEKEYDRENKPMKICYIILSVLSAFGAVSVMAEGGFLVGIPFLVVAILGIFVVKLVDKYSYRPYWQIYRDYYRGYKERNDSFIFNILALPFEVAKSFFD